MFNDYFITKVYEITLDWVEDVPNGEVYHYIAEALLDNPINSFGSYEDHFPTSCITKFSVEDDQPQPPLKGGNMEQVDYLSNLRLTWTLKEPGYD